MQRDTVSGLFTCSILRRSVVPVYKPLTREQLPQPALGRIAAVDGFRGALVVDCGRKGIPGLISEVLYSSLRHFACRMNQERCCARSAISTYLFFH
jgi:hypothetical protein